MNGHAVNAAPMIVIENQSVHIDGEPRWIQTLSLDDLRIVRDRLYRTSLRHEGRALLPLLLPVALVFLVVGLISAVLAGASQEVRSQAAGIALPLAVIIAVPIWLANYDVRRRHRRVVEAAERRWAELVVEIAARQEPPARDPPVKRLAHWWRARRKELNDGD